MQDLIHTNPQPRSNKMNKITFSIPVPRMPTLPKMERITRAVEATAQRIDSARNTTAKQLHRMASSISTNEE